jgi:OFA family oxalate/formate antiporter-like MFS transporter
MEVLKSPIFWTLWLTFIFVVAGGLMCIGLIPSYGKLIVGLTAVEASIAMSVFAAFNGFGRPLAGLLADKIGSVWVMIITYTVQAAIFILFPVFAVTQLTLYIAAAMLGWGYAVILALFPTLTALCFGVRNLGVNYGLVFSAFGVGALAPTIGSWIFDVTGSFSLVFVFVGGMTGIGLFLCIILKKKYALV